MEAAELVPDWGIDGDAYAGPGDRQIVLFAEEARAAVLVARSAGLCYPRFRENITVTAIDPGSLAAGTRLTIGEAQLVVTSTQKKCYPECSLVPDECEIQAHVAFCRIAVGGTITIGSDILVR
jgi:MOSC domain-containing protein YiiM